MIDVISEPIPVQIVLVNGWIFQKMAAKLAEFLPKYGFSTRIGRNPSHDVAINHWMECLDYRSGEYPHISLYITHIDYWSKLYVLRRFMRKASLGICMSSMMVDELSEAGIDRRKLCFILAGHDAELSPRRIRIGLATRLYSDGRKRESILVDLARAMSLEDFEFSITGSGWEKVIPELEAAGAKVDYLDVSLNMDESRRNYYEQIKSLDYYLYTGLDEGSMGIFDAMAAGIPCILTPQGFHLDVPYAMSHTFLDSSELRSIFSEISRPRRNRVDAVSSMTWDKFAANHARVWRAMLASPGCDFSALLPPTAPDGIGLIKRDRRVRLLCNGNPEGDSWREIFYRIYRAHTGNNIFDTPAANVLRSIKRVIFRRRLQ